MTRGGSFGPHQQMARTSKLKKSSVKSFLVPENNRFELVIKKNLGIIANRSQSKINIPSCDKCHLRIVKTKTPRISCRMDLQGQ
jgi:hypothetical protein